MPLVVQMTYSLAEIIGFAWGVVITAAMYNPGYDVNPTLGTQSGYRSVSISNQPAPGEPVYTVTWLYASLAAEETMTVRSLIASGQITAIDAYNPFNLYTMSIESMQELWETQIVGLIVSILEEWCNASVEAPLLHSIDFAGDKFRSTAAAFQVTTDGECYVMSRNFLASQPEEYGADPSFVCGVTHQMAPTVGVAVVEGGGSAQALKLISDGISDLAHRSVVQSINNGSAIADLATGDVTTAP